MTGVRFYVWPSFAEVVLLGDQHSCTSQLFPQILYLFVCDGHALAKPRLQDCTSFWCGRELSKRWACQHQQRDSCTRSSRQHGNELHKPQTQTKTRLYSMLPLPLYLLPHRQTWPCAILLASITYLFPTGHSWATARDVEYSILSIV
jgi:hypothetical protein